MTSQGRKLLILSQTSPSFYVSAVQAYWKHCGKRRNCSWRATSRFPTVFSTLLENFLLFFIIFEIVVCKLFRFGRVWNLSFGKGLEALWKDEKMVTRNFSFTHNSSALYWNLDWSKLKALAVYKINQTQTLKYVYSRIKSIVGKGENADYQYFLLFQQRFLKAIFSGLSKVEIGW